MKSLVGIFAIPFVAPAMTMEQMPKAVKKQTKVEQKTIDKFYTKTKAASGSYDYSGIRFMCSGIMPNNR